MQKTNYGQIARTYNKRYNSDYLPNVGIELKQLIAEKSCNNILEVGCGTAKWIQSLDYKNLNVLGMDLSFEMLKIPKSDWHDLKLLNADANYIPLKDNFFDLVFCVNAIHHFPDKALFLKECNRILSKNGIIAVFGVDPHVDKDWYVYKYFNGVYENDLKRFLSNDQLKELLSQNRFTNINIKTIEVVSGKRIGAEVLSDPFLEKHSNSQLANLTDSEYQSGINKLKARIEKDPGTGFITSVIFYLISATKS